MGSSEGLQLVGRGVVPRGPRRGLWGIPGPDRVFLVSGFGVGRHAGAARGGLVRRLPAHDRRRGSRVRVRRAAADRRRRKRPAEAVRQPPAEAARQGARGEDQGVGRQATARQGLRAGGGESDPGDDERPPHHHGRGHRRVLQVRRLDEGSQAPPAARRARRRRRRRTRVQRPDPRARTRGAAPRGALTARSVGKRAGPEGQQDRRGSQRHHLRRRRGQVAQGRRAAEDGGVQGRDGHRVVPTARGADPHAAHRPGRVRG